MLGEKSKEARVLALSCSRKSLELGSGIGKPVSCVYSVVRGCLSSMYHLIWRRETMRSMAAQQVDLLMEKKQQG